MPAPGTFALFAAALALAACQSAELRADDYLRAFSAVERAGGGFDDEPPATLALPNGGRIEMGERIARDGALERDFTGIGPVRRIDPSGKTLWVIDETLVEEPVDETGTQPGIFDLNRHCLGFAAPVLLARDRVFVIGFSRYSSGSRVVAFDLATGDQLWTERVRGLGEIIHSRYDNNVHARLVNGNLAVLGVEGAGSYVEVYDPDGRMLLTKRW